MAQRTPSSQGPRGTGRHGLNKDDRTTNLDPRAGNERGEDPAATSRGTGKVQAGRPGSARSSASPNTARANASKGLNTDVNERPTRAEDTGDTGSDLSAELRDEDLADQEPMTSADEADVQDEEGRS